MTSEIKQELQEIQEQLRITNRGLRAYELVPIILEEERKSLKIDEIAKLADYGRYSILKAVKTLVKDRLICYEETIPGKTWGSYSYFLLPEGGLKLLKPKRRSGRRGSGGHYIKKIVPTKNKTMILESTGGYTWEVEWLKCPLARTMKMQVSTFVLDPTRKKTIGVSLHISFEDFLGVHYHHSTIRAYFKEAK